MAALSHPLDRRFSILITFDGLNSQVVLLRFGRDYDPDCKLMDDILHSISETVKASRLVQ